MLCQCRQFSTLFSSTELRLSSHSISIRIRCLSRPQTNSPIIPICPLCTLDLWKLLKTRACRAGTCLESKLLNIFVIEREYFQYCRPKCFIYFFSFSTTQYWIFYCFQSVWLRSPTFWWSVGKFCSSSNICTSAPFCKITRKNNGISTASYKVTFDQMQSRNAVFDCVRYLRIIKVIMSGKEDKIK